VTTSSSSSTQPSVPAAEQHEEWLLDEAIAETFPASDPVALGLPGSIVYLRYAAREHRAAARRSSMSRSVPWWLLAGAAVCVVLLLRRRTRASRH
jgi:hypothetical protein